jgi:hypothetical protein
MLEQKILGDYVLFSIGRASAHWKRESFDDRICASDPSFLGNGGKAENFCIIFAKDDEGERTGEKFLCKKDSCIKYEADDYTFQDKIASQFSFLNIWEYDAIAGFIDQYEMESSLRMNSCKGKIAVGAGGDLIIDSNEGEYVPNSLIVNATVYIDCDGVLDSKSVFGIDTTNNEPVDEKELCAAIWFPSPRLLSEEIDEAAAYFIKYSGSLNLYLQILNHWQYTETEELRRVWEIILKNLPKDKFPPNHVDAARLAKTLLKDDQLYRALIEQAKTSDVNGKSVFAYINVCEELSSDLENNRGEIYEILSEAVELAAVEDEAELCHIVETVSGRYSGCRLGDVEFAKNAIEKVVSRVSDTKLRTRIKAEKTLQDYS